MDIGVGNIVLACVVLLILPVMIGNTTCGILKLQLTLSQSYVYGNIVIWAICQVVAVPLILLKADFRIVVGILSIVYLGLAIYGKVKKWYIKHYVPYCDKKTQMMAVLVMIIMCLTILMLETILQHTDADDSRFVVNAVDIIRTNKMFLINPGTGEMLDIWKGELTRDVISPWAVYIAYCAKLTGIHPTIMAHAFMTITLLIAVFFVYWIISKEFYNDILYRCIMVCFILLLDVYGYCSLYTK